MKCDLHCHSRYSFDSTQSVEDILNRAREKGISVIALCDHNTGEGSIEAQKQSDIEVIPGIEIDCFFKETIIHITAYGIDLTNPYIDELKEKYIQQLAKVGILRKNLIEQKYGCTLDEEKLKSIAHGEYPYTNVEIEQVLFADCDHPDLEPYKTGDKRDNPIANFYWDHLAIGKWGYVEMQLPDYIEVIDRIHRLKGIVICAHPKITIGKDRRYIQCLIDDGIDGFESYCSYHNKDDALFYKNICKENGLCITVGSDYHGETKPNIQLGDTGFEGDCTQIVYDLKRRIKEMQG